MRTCGIYKLTSPNGKVYIGQSYDVERRWEDYRKLRRGSIGVRLYNSLRKYIPENFKFEVIHELPSDIDQNILNTYENIYWKQYVDCNYVMLNSRECDGSSGRHSEETKKRMSEASLGVPKSDIHKEALRQSKLKKPTKFWEGKEFSEDHKKKLSKAKLGKEAPNKGKLMPVISEKYKKNYVVDNGEVVKTFYMSKTDLRKLLGLSLKTFNKILSGKKCKKIKNPIIYESK